MIRFNNISKDYERYRVEYPEEFIAFITKKFNLNKKKTYCDLGCGTGKFTKNIISLAKEIDGVDLSKKMLTIARKLGDNFNSINKDAEEIITPKKYDIIFISHSFHWMKKEIVLRNSARNLKKKGYIVIFWNNSLDREKKYYKEIQQLVRNYHLKPISTYRGTDTKELLHQTGLFRKSTHKQFFFKTKYTVDEYLGLLKSKSYISDDIPKKCQKEFFKKAKKILLNEKSELSENFVTDMYYAQVK